MSGAEAMVVDDESPVESVVQPVQPALLGLNDMEIEFLETLIGVSTKVADKKGTKYSVDVRRVGDSISFSSYTLQGAPSVSFQYDLVQHQIVNLRGIDVGGVKDFLMKYRILED
jgi:hypothetical protein